MNLEQKNQIPVLSGLWKMALKPLIKYFKKQFEEHALEMIIAVVTDAFDKHGDDEEETAIKEPQCPKGYYWDTTTNSCQPDIV